MQPSQLSTRYDSALAKMSEALASLSQYADSDSDSDAMANTQPDSKPSINQRARLAPHETEVKPAAAPTRLKR